MQKKSVGMRNSFCESRTQKIVLIAFYAATPREKPFADKKNSGKKR